MSKIIIRSNRDLLDLLKVLKEETTRFFESNDRGTNGIKSQTVELQSNLELNEHMCELIGSSLKYFRGVFDGGNNTITVSSAKTVSLFSSIYHSVIRNVKLHNVKGSKGLLLADDATNTIFENIQLTGTTSVNESLGGLVRITQNVLFQNCNVDFITNSRSKDINLDGVSADPLYFGAYVGVDLGGSKFENCKVTGKISGEVCVGGFCATSRDAQFIGCKVENLKVEGNREVGLFIGKGSNKTKFTQCTIGGSTITANIYVGYLIGKTEGDIELDSVIVHDSFINTAVAASYVGGVTGTARKIHMQSCYFSGSITANFIVAGVCADVDYLMMKESVLNLTITATGYHPMMTHVYPVARKEYLTSRGKDIECDLVDNEVDVKVIELDMEGLVNPFRESIL